MNGLLTRFVFLCFVKEEEYGLLCIRVDQLTILYPSLFVVANPTLILASDINATMNVTVVNRGTSSLTNETISMAMQNHMSMHSMGAYVC